MRQQTNPERVTICTDAQEAIKCTASEELGRGQTYALQARHIAMLRKTTPDTAIESRWRLAKQGRSKEREGRRVCQARVRGASRSRGGMARRLGPDGGVGDAAPHFAHLKREISEKKWTEACYWAGGRASGKKYTLPSRQQPDGTVAGSSKRFVSRIYQPKAGRCLTGQCLNWAGSRPTA